MGVIEFLSEPIWQRLGLTFLHFLWQALTVAVLIAAVVHLFKLRRGNVRYLSYLAAFVIMTACPVVTFVILGPAAKPRIASPITEARIEEPYAAVPYTTVAAVDTSPVVGTAPTVEIAIGEVEEPAVAARRVALRERAPAYLHKSLPWAMMVWMAGVFGLSLRLLAGFVGVYRWRRRLEALPESLHERVAVLSKSMGMSNFSRVFVSPSALQAIAVGYLRPMVLLPASMVTQMPPEMIEAVIAHELAHIRRFDLWVNLLQRIVETLLFYHPAVWWLSNRLRSERELCCDELAVKATGKHLAYAAALENAARVKARRPVVAVALGQDRKPILGRVRHVLGLGPTEQNSRSWLAGVVAVLCLATIAVSVAFPLAARRRDRDKEAAPSKLTSILESGVTVELLGVCEHPSEGEQWWRPDGLPMEPLFDRVSYDRDTFFNNYIFSVRLKGMPLSELGLIHWRSTGADHIRNTTAYLDGKRIYHNNILTAAGIFPVNSGSTDLQIGLATGKWQTIASGSHRGYYENGDDTFLVGSPLLRFAGGEILNIGITHNINYKEREFRVLAVDKSGIIHYSAEHGSGHSNNLNHQDAVFPELNRKQLKEYRFQTRPYEWAKFKNVSLKANFKTDVQIEVEKAGVLSKGEDYWGEVGVAGSGGPLDIRLAAVRPDGSDALYDRNGKKITENTFANIDTNWSKENQYRTFIFELPATDDPIKLVPFSLKIKSAGGKRSISTFQHPLVYYSGGKLMYSVGVSFARKRKGIFARRIKAVDLTLHYYYGRPRKVDFAFTGPFIAGKTIKADDGGDCELTATKERFNFGNDVAAYFTVSSPTRFDSESVVVYDKSGRRYIPEGGSGSSNNQGSQYRYHVEGLTLKSIGYVTVGEKLYERKFTNVRVSYPDRPAREKMEFLDEFSERLGLTDLSPRELYEYQFENPADAIKVIDIVRGQWSVMQTFNAIRHADPKLDLSTLDEQTQQTIRNTCARWTKADHPEIQVMGMRLGMSGRWPEFLDMAIERLESIDSPIYDMVAHDHRRRFKGTSARLVSDVANYRGQVQAEQIERIGRIIRQTDHPRVLQHLQTFFWRADKELSFKTCWDLAQDERPWIWWPAVGTLMNSHIQKLRPFEDLPDKMLMRVIQVQGADNDAQPLFDVSRNGKDYETLAEQAYSMLPQMLTTKLARMRGNAWRNVYNGIVRHLGRETATGHMIGFLQDISTEETLNIWASDSSYFHNCCWMAERIASDLNTWYGTNLGDLGTKDINHQNENVPKNILELKELIAETLEWYDGNENLKPIELTFTGRIVDTESKPIEGAVVNFTKIENYKDDKGRRRQRTVEIGAEPTNASGEFTFRNLPKVKAVAYDLNVSAEGFADRAKLAVWRLPDGRFQWLQDNVVVMQRPAAVTGKAIGPDGGSLANAELSFFQNNHYTYAEDGWDRRIKTDARGGFVLDNVTSGHHVLSFTKGGAGREYGGKCAAVMVEIEEGRNRDNVVLDVSKSVCSMEVEVLDKAGKPVDNVSFHFDIETPQTSQRAYVYSPIFSAKESNPQGLYRFEGLPQGKFMVRAYNRELGPDERIEANLLPNQTTRLKIQFKKSLKPKEKPDVQVKPGKPATEAAENTEETTQFKASLANGVTVELVGVCEDPGEGTQWWAADGTVIASPGDDFGFVTIGGKTFNVKVEGGSDGYEVSCDELVENGPDLISANISVGVAGGPWHTLRKAKEHQQTYSFGRFHALIIPAKMEGGRYVVRVWETAAASFDPDYARRYAIKLNDQHELINMEKYLRDVTDHPGEHRPFENLYVLNPDMRGRIEYIAGQYCGRQIVTFNNVSLAAGHKTDVQIDVRKTPEPEFIYMDMSAPPSPVLKDLSSDNIKGVSQLIFHAVHPQTLWQVIPWYDKHKPKWYFRINGKDYPLSLSGHFAFSGYEVIEGFVFPYNLADREKKWEQGDYSLAVVVKNLVWWAPSGESRPYKEVATKPVSFRILENGDFASKAGHKLLTASELRASKAVSLSGYTATLANGVTVELIGFCENPSEGKLWWRPDGGLLETRPYERWGSHESAGSKTYEYVYRIAANEAVVYEVKADGQLGGGGPDVLKGQKNLLSEFNDGQHYGGALFFPEGLDETNVSIGVGLEKNFKTVCSTQGDVTKAMSGYENVFLYSAVEADGITHVNAEYRFAEGKRQAWRLIAVDTAGKEHVMKRGGWSGSKQAVHCKRSVDLPAKQIAAIHFQTQPLEWVTFNNVSLRPRVMTDAAAEVEDELLLVGVWRRTRSVYSDDDQEGTELMVLNADRRWLQAMYPGRDEIPTQFRNIVRGPRWAVNEGRLWQYHPRPKGGGEHTWIGKLLSVTPMTLAFENMRRRQPEVYTRVHGQTEAQIRKLLTKSDK